MKTVWNPDDDNDPALFAAVLAAGAASRFGSPKQLAPYEGTALVRRAVLAAEAVAGERSVLCTGHEWRKVFEAASPLKGFLIMNDGFERGMGSSIAAVVRALPSNAAGLLLVLADQPQVDAHSLARLASHWREQRERIVCCRFGAVQGPPAVFPAGYFAELAELDGDRGAKGLLERYADNVEDLRIEAAAADVDTPADLSRLADRGDR